jgi:hypothetical protein
LIPPALVRRLKPNSLVESGSTRFFAPFQAFKFRFFALLFALSTSIVSNTFAQQQPSEYDLKAAFLFNFAKFVEWPPEVFAGTNSPIVIGILGKDVFGDTLGKIINDRKVNNRGFAFRHFDSANEATNCQILFVSSSERNDFAKIVSALHNASVLTVSEADGFLKAGGMINFLIEGKNIRFQISDEAAKKAQLKVSSKLLSLAVPGP